MTVYFVFLRNNWTYKKTDILYIFLPFLTMKTTFEKVVSINFFSPLEASFHLSYCTTFSDQVYNLRFHCSPCFRSLPVIYFYFSALPGSKNQGLYILFVDFRPGFVVKREHTHTHTNTHTYRDLRFIYKIVRRNKLFSVLDVSFHYIVLVKFFRFIYFILSFVASSLHLMVCAAALQQVQPLRGCCIVPSQVKTLKITAASRYFLECLHFSFGAICQHPFRTLLWLL